MSASQIIEAIKRLSPTQQLAIVQSTLSLLQDEIDGNNNLSPAVEPATTSFVAEVVALGEEARRKGAPALPSDYAKNHDYYLYRKPKK